MTRRIKRHRKLKTVDRNATDCCSRLLYCYCSMFCLNCTLCWCYNIVISGKILRSVRQKLIAISGISLYRRSLYRGFCPIHFTATFAGTYLSLYRGYRYIGVQLCISYFRNSYTKGCQPYIAQDRLVFRTTEWKVTHTAYREYKSLAFVGGKGARTRQRELALTT